MRGSVCFCMAWGLLVAGLALPTVTHGQVPKRPSSVPGGAPRPGIPASNSPNTPPSAPAAAPARLNTQINFELLTGEDGVGPRAQRWSQLFERLNVTLAIRRGRGDEKLETKEEIIGRDTRRVTVIGRLDMQGKLTFIDRQFAEADGDKLTLWIRDLRAYGAQGTPEGQPLWGLSKIQFGTFFQGLSTPLPVEVQGLDFEAALAKFNLQKNTPVQRSAAASKHLAGLPRGQAVVQSLQGITLGTALAAYLNEFGLGFLPRRMATGEVRLEIVSLAETNDVWPVGWPTDQPLNKLVPRYFSFTQIEINKLPLEDVIEAAGDVIEARILVDHAGLAGKGVKVADAVVSHPSKKATWAMALRTMAFQIKGKPDIYVDEAGKPLIWISPIGSRRGEDDAGR